MITMKPYSPVLATLALAGALAAPAAAAADLSAGMSEGKAELKSIGPIAFGPEGILFAADSKAAAVYAIATGDTKGVQPESLKVEKLDEKIAAVLGTSADQILLNDLAVNPASGTPYLAVSRGKGPDAAPVLLRVTAKGALEVVSLDSVKHAMAALPDAPADQVVGEGRRRGNPRLESITDIAYTDGDVIVAGLSNEEFASSLRRIPFPFKDVTKGTSVEIYHGAHGQYETRSPVRTFAPLTIGNEPHLLAAYTCTPLVQFPLKSLEPGTKIRGTTIAELGNRNRPLDMVVYQKGAKAYLLIANNARGIMKVSTDEIADVDAIDSRVEGGESAGLPYDTIDDWKGVEQLDRYNAESAIIVQRGESDGLSLATLPFP